MKEKYDHYNDIYSIVTEEVGVANEVFDTHELIPGVKVHTNFKGRIVGIEIDNLFQRVERDCNFYTCPVCGWNKLNKPPYHSYDICPCCGAEFGYSDCADGMWEYYIRLQELRDKWITKKRMEFKYQGVLEGWDPIKQLQNIGYEPTER